MEEGRRNHDRPLVHATCWWPRLHSDLFPRCPSKEQGRSDGRASTHGVRAERLARPGGVRDTWHRGPSVAQTFSYLTNSSFHHGRVPEAVSAIVGALRQGIGTNRMLASAVEMAVRLVELRHVWSPGRPSVAWREDRIRFWRRDCEMRIVVVNVNTSQSITDGIDAAAWRHASPGTEIVTLQPYFGWANWSFSASEG